MKKLVNKSRIKRDLFRTLDTVIWLQLYSLIVINSLETMDFLRNAPKMNSPGFVKS